MLFFARWIKLWKVKVKRACAVGAGLASSNEVKGMGGRSVRRGRMFPEAGDVVVCQYTGG
jgi:hypothetical protein